MSEQEFIGQNIPITVELPKDSVLRRLVPAHSKKSREVTQEDVDRVVEETRVLHAICFEQYGMYGGAYAMAHPQIEDKDPLKFFVTADRKIIINPVITKHSNYLTSSKEGCVTFAGTPRTTVDRWHKCEVEYVTIMVDPDNKDKFKLSSKIEESLSSLPSFIFQHECDHLDGKYIFPYEHKDEYK